MTYVNLESFMADRPDAAHVTVVGGEVFFEFGAIYRHSDGRDFCISFWATGFEDAESRISAMRATLQLDGQIVAEISELERTK